MLIVVKKEEIIHDRFRQATVAHRKLGGEESAARSRFRCIRRFQHHLIGYLGP